MLAVACTKCYHQRLMEEVTDDIGKFGSFPSLEVVWHVDDSRIYICKILFMFVTRGRSACR